MQINIAFSYPNKFKIGAKIISLFLNKPYSHALIYWYSEHLNRTLVYQASHGMVHFIELTNFLKHNKIIKKFEVDINDEQHRRLVQKCIDLSGESYSFFELFITGIYDIAFKLGIPLNISNRPGYVCSNLISTIIKDIFNKEYQKPAHLIDPSDLDEFLTTSIY